MTISFAQPDEAAAAMALFREAATWLMNRDCPLWPVEMFTEADTLQQATRNELVMAREGGIAVACMLIATSDVVFWPDEPAGSALYLHKIVVTRAAAGQGWSQRMVDWAEQECRTRGLPAIRLDCEKRPKLIDLYRSLGFIDVDDCNLPFGIVVRRFEKQVI